MEINYNSQEISVKIVYYGPGLSGKTTNLEVIHAKTPDTNRGKLTAISTDQDRTLFFDYMPLEIGKIGNFKVRLRLFTVPGQVYYNTTRRLVLRCVDGVVFVADSQEHKITENIESLQNLRENLAEQGENLDTLSVLFQYNKRDLPNITPIEELNAILNHDLQAPYYPAVAVKGDGVFQSLKHIANVTMSKVEGTLKQKPKRIKKVTKKEGDEVTPQDETAISPPSNTPVSAPSALSVPGKAKISPHSSAGAQPQVGEGGVVPRLGLSSTRKTSSINIAQVQPPSNTPPRGMPAINIQANKKATARPSISLDNLFQGSLSQSKPIRPGMSPATSGSAPSSVTPASSPSLPLNERTTRSIFIQKKEDREKKT